MREQPGIRFLETCRVLFLALLPFSWALGGYYLYEWTVLPDAGDGPLVSGTVVDRAMVEVWHLAKRPELSIRIDDSGETVRAILSLNAIDDLPAQVTFYFTGDARAQVHLREEDPPLLPGLFFVLGPAVVLGALPWLLRRARSRL